MSEKEMAEQIIEFREAQSTTIKKQTIIYIYAYILA